MTLDDNYGVFDIQVRDVTNKDENSELYLPFLLKEAINIFSQDKNEKYISEKNQDFLKETGAVKNYNYNDAFLRPPLVSKCIYDFMTGSIGSKTPLRYNLNYRNFYYVTSGKINIKLIPLIAVNIYTPSRIMIILNLDHPLMFGMFNQNIKLILIR